MTIQINGTSGISGVDGSATTPAIQGTDTNTGLTFGTDTVGVVTGGTTRTTVDSSGRLLVGTSTSANDNIDGTGYANIVQILGAATGAGLKVGNTAAASRINIVRNESVGSGVELGALSFGTETPTSVERARISSFSQTTGGSGGRGGQLRFYIAADGSANPTERMRISNTGNLGLFNTASDSIYISNTVGAGTGTYFIYALHSASTLFNGTNSFRVTTNGNVYNTNGTYTSISDRRLKENIVDANSQWQDIRSLRIRNFNYREDTGNETHRQIGLIAQELEQVSPGLVTAIPFAEGEKAFDADGNELNELKTVNMSVLYMKAVKALQEAMERIETLEAKVTQLEGGTN